LKGDSMESLIGQLLGGKYEIRSEIGRGGMGVVYYGYDTMLQRAVAIKVLPSALTYDRQFVERFRQEAVAAASLHHPGIVTIHDVGETVLPEQGQARIYFIVMQYLEGTTLDQLLQSRGPLALQQANHLVRQVGDALDYAHQRGMIHRDIKPSNIMVSPDGHATLMDFGLVRAGEGAGLTRTGVVVGTPEYMAPEQAMGEPVDARTDIYSFGVVIYRVLTGHVPFAKSNSMATVYAHVHEPPPPLRQTRPEIPKAVEAVVLKTLAKAPSERYQRAGLLADDFAVAITNKMPAGLKAATVAATVATPRPGATAEKSPLPAVRTPTPADATQLIGRQPPPPATPRRSPGVALIGGVALLLVAAVAAAILMLNGQGKDAAPPSAGKGVIAQPTAAADAVVAGQTATPTPFQPTATVRPVAPEPTATQAKSTATATVRETPTATATQRPSTATPTATSVPPTATATSKPPTPTATSKPPTPTATPQPAQPTNTKSPATPTAAPTPAQPTATPKPAALAAPALAGPNDGAIVSGTTTFTWQWSGAPLAANEAFEVRLWKEGQLDHYGATAPVRSPSATFDVGSAYGVQQGGSGGYFWTVAVVQIEPYQRTGEEAPPRSISVEVGGGGGGSGGPDATPTPR
jgi:eukaryotic-like serine/threonine-protein kinase